MTEQLRRLRIGYAPISRDLRSPGDRRRFAHYAARRGISFEIARPTEGYDLVVLTQDADLGLWSRYSRGRLVYDAPDAYLAVPGYDFKGMLRGAARFVTGRNRRLQLSFRRAIEGMCRRADAVICCTDEQRQRILPFCRNVHSILDFQVMAVRRWKTDYQATRPFNLVWEGLADNVPTLASLVPVLDRVAARHPLALHVITEADHYRYARTFGRCATTDLLRRVVGRPWVYYYQWNEAMLAAICSAADLAVIPIPLDNPLLAGKPENKLVLFWRMGLPTVTSPTPAYARTMVACGLSMICQTTDEWVRMLERCIEDDQLRREAGQRGRAFAEEHHDEERLLCRWDEALSSALA